MSIKQLTSKEYFKTMQTIYFAFIAVQVFFCVVLLFLYLIGKYDSESKSLRDIFIFIVPLFVVGGIFGSNALFSSMLKASKSMQALTDKMNGYRYALILRYAFLEGPSLFAIVVYFLTGDLLFLAMSALIILIFLTIKPTPDRAVKDLELNLDDHQAICDPNKIIAQIETGI
jgi:hypothetical protein